MILIYWKWKVGKGIADLCDFLRIDYELRDDTDVVDYSKYTMILPSPGIPSHHHLYATGKVKSELDFAFAFLPKSFHIVAVTGTDGKSTTSWVLYELLRHEFGEERVYLSWNFDVPFSLTVKTILEKKQKFWYIVVEVSSFMAYSLHSFQPEYSIFTNFKADHLNWHKDLSDYFRAKMNLIRQTRKKSVIHKQVQEFALSHGLDPLLPENSRIFWAVQAGESGAKSSKALLKDRTDGDAIILSWRKKYRLSETHFSGLHNALNILSATVVTSLMGICSQHVAKYLREINGLPHRLEKIGEKNGIIFVEDSKSTSSQSLEAALSSYGDDSTKNLLLIVGWSDKGDVFDALWDSMRKRVKYLVCIWATKEAFIAIAQKQNIAYLATDSLAEWVQWLYSQAVSGDVLMLSPWCASFWLFRDYLDRAEQFREAVKKLQ